MLAVFLCLLFSISLFVCSSYWQDFSHLNQFLEITCYPFFPCCQNNTLHIFPFTADPGDSRPMLLIGGSDGIVITHLNGTGLQPLRSLSVNGTLALDFQHNQESVCWALSTESSGQLRCAETRNLRGFTREQEIRTQQSLQRMFSSIPSSLILQYCFSFPYFSDERE